MNIETAGNTHISKKEKDLPSVNDKVPAHHLIFVVFP